MLLSQAQDKHHSHLARLVYNPTHDLTQDAYCLLQVYFLYKFLKLQAPEDISKTPNLYYHHQMNYTKYNGADMWALYILEIL